MLGDEQREVRVLGLAGRILIAVAVDGHDAVRVLMHDRSLRIHAEGAHQVLIFFGLIDDFALIQLVSQVLEDLCRKLHANADVDAVGKRPDAKLSADALHPLAAAAADGDDALLAGMISRIGHDLIAAVLLKDLTHRRAEVEIDLRLELGEEVFQHDEVDICAEMADGGVEQVEAALQAARLEGAVRGGVELCARTAVRDVDLVHIIHQLQRLLFADVLIERAAEVISDVVLAVGERTCAAEAVHDRTGRAADAVLHVLAVNGALALFQRLSLLKYGDFQLRTELRQLIGGENTAGAGANDDHVILHIVYPFRNSENRTPWGGICLCTTFFIVTNISQNIKRMFSFRRYYKICGLL